jgi:hypothetical protein
VDCAQYFGENFTGAAWCSRIFSLIYTPRKTLMAAANAFVEMMLADV